MQKAVHSGLPFVVQKPEATFVAGYKACEKTLMYACQQQKRLLDGHMVRYVADHEMLGGVG